MSLELELPRDAAVTIVGASFAAGFPRSTHVDAVGDVNGDRRPDLLVANHQGHGGDAARSYVVFGGSWPARLSLSALGARGFRTADVVEPAGDVNGDGRADLIACGRTTARILFGRTGRRAAAPGAGFRLTGATCASRAGDIDGDAARICSRRRTAGAGSPASPWSSAGGRRRRSTSPAPGRCASASWRGAACFTASRRPAT
jgi:hypothetical protein